MLRFSAVRIIAGGILCLALDVAALPQEKKERDYADKHARGKSPELYKQFVQLMEANAAEYKGIQEEIEKNSPVADIRKRLAKIREIAKKADAVKYRKDEAEAEKLERHFELFELKLTREFDEAPWDTRENRLHLLERLKAKCDVCHETLRD